MDVRIVDEVDAIVENESTVQRRPVDERCQRHQANEREPGNTMARHGKGAPALWSAMSWSSVLRIWLISLSQ